MENSSVLDEAKKQRLYADIYDDSMWLVQLVANLLSIPRLENGGLDLRIQPELLEEVAGEALLSLIHISRSAGGRGPLACAGLCFLYLRAAAPVGRPCARRAPKR